MAEPEPEIATWPPEPEILISLELRQIGLKFQRQVWGVGVYELDKSVSKQYCDNSLTDTRKLCCLQSCDNFRFSITDHIIHHTAIRSMLRASSFIYSMHRRYELVYEL